MRDHLRNPKSDTVAFVWTHQARSLAEKHLSVLETISSAQASELSTLQKRTQSTCEPRDQLAKLSMPALLRSS